MHKYFASIYKEKIKNKRKELLILNQVRPIQPLNTTPLLPNELRGNRKCQSQYASIHFNFRNKNTFEKNFQFHKTLNRNYLTILTIMKKKNGNAFSKRS